MEFRDVTVPGEIMLTFLGNAEHTSNCVCSLKTWADESQCDCGLRVLREAYLAANGEPPATRRWKEHERLL